ncbi:MAG: phosphate/phosphite/phosphonate ABC transporter substrate-binding protein [Proteobacteria bacterium]|nr:phosphate/phosphite/phosphonate ABC transporter substrate-binding protein [Pseudomonadota bacterium]MBU1688599.1 phosphate/phosphite/phosphonate ABC transporter substrate-binding protein [Pseudomonadota bacterium]
MRYLKKYFYAFVLFLFLPISGHCQELIFSTHPFTNPTAIHKRFEPLVSYLAQKTGVNISIRIAPSYLAHIKALGSGEADLGFAGPSPYVRMKDKYGGIELLARFKFIDDQNDKVVLITGSASQLKTIRDLKGKSFAFGDHQSFGSHFMPRWVLHENGVSLHDLTAYDFVKSHDNVILSVLHGDFDAGGVRQDVFEKYADRPLRVLAGPFAIPPHVLVCRTSLSTELKVNLKQGLLAMKERVILDQINGQLTGFEPVKDSDFDQARKIMGFIESR